LRHWLNRRGAVMFGYRYDKSAKGQRRRIVVAIGQSGSRMPDGCVVALFVEIRLHEQNLMAPGEVAMGAGVIGLEGQGPFKKRHGLPRLCAKRLRYR
jgi:hypothetical protein